MTGYDHGGDLFAVARRLGVRPDELIDFSASINPLGMPQGVRNAIAGKIDMLCHYPDADAQPFREALAAFHRISPEQIAASNGTTEMIYLIPRLFKGGRKALIIAPAFSEYAKSLAAAGWSLDYHILSPMDRFDLHIDGLAERLSERFGILFLCNPGNPTGRLYTIEEIEKVIDLCNKAGTYLVLDEAFIDFCGEDASAVGLVSKGNNLILLRSMTKFYAIPGLRLGYAVAGAEICDRISLLRGPWSVNTLAQAAGTAGIEDVDFRTKSREYISQERARLAAGLNQFTSLQLFNSAANYVLIQLGFGHKAENVCRRLSADRILIRNCNNFMGMDDTFLRLAVKRKEDNDLLLSKLKILVG